MTKKELVTEILSKENVSKVECEAIVDSLFELISQELVLGKEVSIANFGKFAIKESAARKGVNPSTGETIEIQASKTAKFKPAKQLKEKLNVQ